MEYKKSVNPENYKAGQWFTLPEDLNCIPAGTYQIESTEADTIYFKIGRSALAGITGASGEIIRKLKNRPAKTTSVAQFFKRYYVLLERDRQECCKSDAIINFFMSSGPKTSLAITPEADERYRRRYCSLH